MNISTYASLRTALVVRPECRGVIDKDHTMDCSYPQIVEDFYDSVSRLFSIRFQMLLASDYGTGASSENDTLYQMLGDGIIDFIGPHATFTAERDKIAKRGHTIFDDHVSLYAHRRLAGTDYSLVDLVGVNLFLAALIVSGLLLNLYASFLSVKLANEESVGVPNFSTKTELQNAIQSGEISIVLPPKLEGYTYSMETSLLEGADDVQIKKIKNKLIYSSSVGHALRLVKGNNNYLAMLQHVYVQLTDEWLDYCDTIIRRPIPTLISSDQAGFYFSLQKIGKNSEKFRQLNKFKKIVNSNEDNLRGLYFTIRRSAMFLQQNHLKCADDYRMTHAFSIGLKSCWKVSFKSIWLYGIGVATVLLCCELIQAKWAKQFSGIHCI